MLQVGEGGKNNALGSDGSHPAAFTGGMKDLQLQPGKAPKQDLNGL